MIEDLEAMSRFALYASARPDGLVLRRKDAGHSRFGCIREAICELDAVAGTRDGNPRLPLSL